MYVRNRAVVSGGAGNLGVLLTLFQPEGADYVHHITASNPRFENLTTSLFSHCLGLNYYVNFFGGIGSNLTRFRLCKIRKDGRKRKKKSFTQVDE